jgi:hypothetical protein
VIKPRADEEIDSMAPLNKSLETSAESSLSETSLRFEACVIMRADDDSRLVNEFVRSFLRKYAPQRPPPKQMELPLSA